MVRSVGGRFVHQRLIVACAAVAVAFALACRDTTIASGSAAKNAIDGNLSTSWVAPAYTGWLSLQFPTALTITGIRMAANSDPSSSRGAAAPDGRLVRFHHVVIADFAGQGS
jgi:hypothetical protein